MSSILVVDDVDDIRDLCRIVLEAGGHEVLEAATGESALDIVAATPPEAMLLDIGLPGIDGWEVLRSIRNRPELNHLNVVVCSAHAGPADRVRAYEEGAAGFLGKPFHPRELRQLFEPS